MTNKVRSIVVEGRVDARSLATIAQSLKSRQVPIRSRSHLVSMIIESYADMLISGNQGYTVETTEQALEILESIGIDFKNTVKRNLTKLAKAIHNERALETLTGNIDPTNRPMIPDALLDQAQSKMDADE